MAGASELDFRDVHAVDDRKAYLLSIGEGKKSRIYQTTDGGKSWTLEFMNPDAKAFSMRSLSGTMIMGSRWATR